MEFTNATVLPAVLARGSTGDREMVGVVAAKLTCHVKDDRLVRSPEEDWWPVFEQPHLFEGVTLGAEMDFRKRAVDILVFGQAMAPRDEPVRQMRLGIHCGVVRFEIEVIGDRSWLDTKDGPIASDPAPFLSMPLTNDRAFGGQALLDGLSIPHSVNPVGRGLCLSSEGVHGTPLPNLERPDSRIHKWDDRPPPACLYRTLAPHIDEAMLTKDPVQIAAHFLEEAGQDAVPELVAPPGELGSELILRGFDPWQDVRLPLPSVHGPEVVVTTGRERSRFPTTISTVIALVEPRALVVTYRAVFRYLFRPGEERRARLEWRRRAQSAPAAEASTA